MKVGMVLSAVFLVGFGAFGYYVIDKLVTAKTDIAGFCSDVRTYQASISGLSPKLNTANTQSSRTDVVSDTIGALRTVTEQPLRLPPKGDTDSKRLYDAIRDQQSAFDRAASALSNGSMPALTSALDAYSRAEREEKALAAAVCP
jgi:hypothetical protein